MQKILINIINGFIKNNLINEDKALQTINKILIENNENKITSVKEFNDEPFSLEKHLKYIDDLRQYLIKKEHKDILLENKINEILGLFIPTQEEINLSYIDDKKFDNLLSLSLVSYYIKTDKNNLNVLWDHNSKYGEMKISINNAKPEKTQEQIIREKNFVSENKNEPKCVICVENINFKGSLIKDSRENLRAIFLNFSNDENWFFQYSPYAYINKHFVLNNTEHTPMVIDNNTMKNLVEFTDKNNNFFLGSNADLPIVGGSLLGHNHYQGGDEVLPIMNAETIESFEFKNTSIDILNWPLNSIKISSKNKEDIIDISNYFINEWKANNEYNLKPINNSTTLIVKKNSNGVFNAYLIFRNNSTSEKRPFGNFHIHESKFNIKQENIGLMEAAGLAILPKRLITETQEIIETYNKNKNINDLYQNDKLSKHAKWIENIINNKIEINKNNLLKEIGNVFVNCLEDCKVINDNQLIDFIKDKIKYNQEVFTIQNYSGLSVEIMRKGFAVKQIKLNDDKFLLEYKDINSYFKNDILLNAFVGPIAGRIEKGIIKLNHKEVNLKTDKNDNYIHGMNEKWSDLLFEIETKTFDDYNIVTGIAKQYNKELDCNYLIKIILKILNNENKITFEYHVTSDKETICNPTHHFYWALPNTKNVFDLNINLDSENYWLLNKNFNPEKKDKLNIGKTIKLSELKNLIDPKQIELVNKGIDHPIEIKKDSSVVLSSPDFKYNVISTSNFKTLVMYSHNWEGANQLLNRSENNHQAICIEYQKVPTSINNPNYDEIVINKNKDYLNITSYEFKIK
ncbi:MAG: hypothetical protein ACRDA7_00600 [Metamycoplasmataceae bacterium]